MSGYKSSPRFEVIAHTRRRWSDDQKRAIVAEVDPGAGVTMSMVARRHALCTSLLFRWRRDLEPIPRPASTFLPVTIAAPTPKALPTPTAPAPPPATKPTTIDIVLANGRTVRVAADADPAAIARLVAALEAKP